MRTTLDIQDKLLVRAKTAAVRERKSLTRLIEEGLALRLSSGTGVKRKAQIAPLLPVFRGGGGLQPGIDPTSNRSLFEAAGDDGA